MHRKINFKKYTEDQLIESLIDVNDGKYLDDAMYIYQLLINKKGLHYSEVNVHTLGIKHNWFLEGVHMGLIYIPFLQGGLHEIYFENYTLDEKIQRLNIHLSAQVLKPMN